MDNERTKYRQIKDLHPEWSLQDTTKRVKRVVFGNLTDPSTALTETVELWRGASSIYDSPLVQLRIIMEARQDRNLFDLINLLNSREGKGRENNIRIAGKIPFLDNQKKLGIYYLQAESTKRPIYKDSRYLSHLEAVQRGFQKQSEKLHKQPLPEGYVVVALDFSDQPTDVLTGRSINVDPEKLAQEIADLHKLAFKFPHDPAQQTQEGVVDILINNPTLVCFNPSGRVASVGFMERDTRFTFSESVLVEPTYFTHPGEGNKGLSSHLRQATNILTQQHCQVECYKGKPMIVFNESIRHSSFILSLENGCNLAGTKDLIIDGNLGEAYTAIGPANPETGFMPMGLTYFISPEIEAK